MFQAVGGFQLGPKGKLQQGGCFVLWPCMIAPGDTYHPALQKGPLSSCKNGQACREKADGTHCAYKISLRWIWVSFP